ncbi:ABC-three component system middle component 6 [Prevotella jejuni]|uniref:ABC-three component system middle component 6 n=1 Tax=Prevotella jejuni TaxID=1177574 RepID=UPI0031FCE9AE
MLLPDNIAPEDSIYYNGAIVLQVVQRERRISLTNLFCEVNKHKTISFSLFLLCLDWLYLIDSVVIQNEEVILCS